MGPRAAIVVMVAADCLLIGCDWVEGVGARINPDSLGLADRCAAVMKAAMPAAGIEIGKLTSENSGIRTIIARVEGTRTDAKVEPEKRELAAECRFDNTVLSGFKWTKGGPPPDAAPN